MKSESLQSWKRMTEHWLDNWDRPGIQLHTLDWATLIPLGLYYSLVLNILSLASWSLAFLILPVTMLVVLKYQRPGAVLASVLTTIWLLCFLSAGWIEAALPTLLLILTNSFAAYFTWKQVKVIDHLKGNVRRAREESECDPLTGLLNRRGFERQAERIMQQCRQSDQGYAILMMDLDNFKQINDTFGHDLGDHVLVQFANALQGVLRSEDLSARFGGEEFLLMLNTDQPAEVSAICQRVRSAVAEIQIAGISDGRPITFSGGLATSRDISNLSALITLADQKLYSAKLGGKNQIIS